MRCPLLQNTGARSRSSSPSGPPAEEKPRCSYAPPLVSRMRHTAVIRKDAYSSSEPVTAAWFIVSVRRWRWVALWGFLLFIAVHLLRNTTQNSDGQKVEDLGILRGRWTNPPWIVVRNPSPFLFIDSMDIFRTCPTRRAVVTNLIFCAPIDTENGPVFFRTVLLSWKYHHGTNTKSTTTICMMFVKTTPTSYSTGSCVVE